MTSGIYMIRNKKTGQIYIGQSKNIEARFNEHCRVSNVDLAIALEGKENFDLHIIEEVYNNRSILYNREQYWIKYYNVVDNPYHYNKKGRRDFDDDMCSIKVRSANNKQGFVWVHTYNTHGKNIKTTSQDLGRLKQMVEKKGFPWCEPNLSDFIDIRHGGLI